jgi:hypothetical protein
MSEPWELDAREQIRHTVAAYAVAGDSGRVEELAAQFCPDGVLEVHGADAAHGRSAIVAMLMEHVAAGAPADEGRPFFIRHHVTNVLVQSLTRTEAHVVAYFAVYTPDGPDHWGRYRDVLVPVEDRWLLQRRNVRVDAAVPGGWHATVFAASS